jgi:hypothetical protein
MTEQFTQIQELLLQMGTDTLSAVIAFLPKLIGAFLVLLIGWLIAKLLRTVVERSLRAGLDALLERTGVNQALESSNITATPSEIVGRVLYWLVMIGFLMAASQILGLDSVTSAITQIFAYIPSVISAALVLAAGVFLARFVGNIVTSGATAADLSYARGLGAVANTSIIVMVGVVTVEQLGVDAQILVTVITVTVAAIMAGMGLAFALGAREVVRGILAGHYLRQSLPEGSEVEVAGERGVVRQIGPISTTFEGTTRSFSIPNSRLLEEVVRIPS